MFGDREKTFNGFNNTEFLWSSTPYVVNYANMYRYFTYTSRVFPAHFYDEPNIWQNGSSVRCVLK
ncbi:MAG: hypothetical protein GX247_00300 [Mollicutes bacterium]|jgi:hypothetical protein|nr:hypothetical protein [Mollicutes bacterium]